MASLNAGEQQSWVVSSQDTTMGLMLLFNTLLLATLSLHQQLGSDVVQIESWKKGDNRVQEQILNIKLTFEGQEYVVDVENASGKTKHSVQSVKEPMFVIIKSGYKLEIQPMRMGEGSQTVISSVELELYEHKNFVLRLFSRRRYRLFLTTKGSLPEGRPAMPQDFAGDFSPRCEESIVGKENTYTIKCLTLPLLKKRAIRIEGFYCILQVSEYKLTENRQALKSITFRVEFMNSRSL